MLKFENDVIVDMTEREETVVRSYKKRELKRQLEPYELFDLPIKNLVNTVEVVPQL